VVFQENGQKEQEKQGQEQGQSGQVPTALGLKAGTFREKNENGI